jgi:hypothetical protein
MTVTGGIMTVFRASILMYIQGGDNTTETMIGMGTSGTMNGFLTNGFSRTGRAGMRINIGRSKKRGASRGIGLDRNSRNRN